MAEARKYRKTVWRQGKPAYVDGLPDTEEVTAIDDRDVMPLVEAASE